MKSGKRLLNVAVFLAAVVLPVQAQIYVGQTAGFTGPLAAGAKEITDGAHLYLDSINSKGGINGQQIELISLDDRSEPSLAADNARLLIEQRDVVAMFLTRGTPHTQAIIPLLNKHSVPLVAPSTGASSLHWPVQKYIFNVRASYQREAEKAIHHQASIGATRIALVSSNDSFGDDGIAGALKGLVERKIQPVLQEKFDRAKPDFAPIIAKAVKADVQVVLLVASGAAVADATSALRQAGSTAQIVTLSNNASTGFIRSLGANSRGVIVTQVFPSERAITIPLVKEAHALARAKGVGEISPAMLEGFAGAKVLVEGLRRAGTKPTREKLHVALESIRKFDLGGLELSFSEEDHTGLDFADLSIIGPDGKFRR